ncbi:Tryptophanyl-tRNA synthetase [uncultured virus]|nr:Tryptophanyl-tRNA synthetase [uncultured virus]
MDQPESKITPWEVKGKINYLAQIDHFGTSPVDTKLVERWERVTKMRAHRFIRRGIVFSHQDIDKILDDVESGKPVYVYTGRGPSSESMHLGHMVPFLFTKYLQDALNCVVIIQMSDDEKYFFKEGNGPKSLETYQALGRKNARDIIACGFDVNKTLIFSDLESNSGDLFFNNCLLMKATNMNQIQGIYGLGCTISEHVVNLCKMAAVHENNQDKLSAYEKVISAYTGKDSSNSVGQCVWPCFQCGPSYSTSFRKLFIQGLSKHSHPEAENLIVDLNNRKGSIRCLVPMAIDQAPFFRLARDVAHKLDCEKPAVIHSEFLPPLIGDGKMGSTGDNSQVTLFLDMDPLTVRDTIKKHAFSGGRATLKEHQELGGDIKIDISYQYLTFFLESDEELEIIARGYRSGGMLSSEIKTLAADLVSKVIKDHQIRKSQVTDAVVDQFFDSTRVLEILTLPPREFTSQEYKGGAGLDFDKTFGL